MVRRAYPYDPDLADIHAVAEAATMEIEVMQAEAAAVDAESAAATMSHLQMELEEARAELVAAMGVMAATTRVDLAAGGPDRHHPRRRRQGR
jgi:hypothetical protein